MSWPCHRAKIFLFLIFIPAGGLGGCAGWFRSGVPASGAGTITIKRLLDEMTDLSHLAEFPDPPYVCRQASSYDRKSKSPTEDWFANNDRSQYLRTEDSGGRKEYVMMDADGPGAIVRLWSANAQGNLRLYLDGAIKPSFAFPMAELLGGKHPLFPPPLAGVVSAGWNLYFPIPYAAHMKVTADSDDKFYYHVGYRTYPEGTPVEGFSLDAVWRLARPIQETVRLLERKERLPEGVRNPPLALAPGEESTLWKSREGQSAIDLLRVRVQAEDLVAALRGVVLRAYFDGETSPAIECPIGDFFGASPGVNPYESLPLSVQKDGTMVSRWFMPFKTAAEFRVVNRTSRPAAVASEFWVRKLPRGWRPGMMHFHAGYRTALDVPTRPQRDFNYMTARGRGVFVGDALAVANPSKAWWGEGDERIYIDGETFPSHFGTGTEDYYGYAWSSPKPFQHPYHNQTRCDGPGNYGHTSVNRFHIIDAIPFQKDFRFDMEIWHARPDVKINCAVVCYWYARPDSTSNFEPPTEADLRVPKLDPLPVFVVKGALEAERLKYSAGGGNLAPQVLSGFAGNWSRDEQVWWTGAKPGDTAQFTFDAPEPGQYEVRANFTKAPDYAIAEISVNGRVAVEKMDFYRADVAPTREISLGTHELKKQGNTMTLRILGANEKAEKAYMLGVDYLLLRPRP